MICKLCPRNCGALRTESAGEGYCRMPEAPVLARAALHQWEEPPISGTRGSGTVFFSGCSLGCVFCQNEKISHQDFGKAVTVERLREICEDLIAQGAHNINFVNPTHYAHVIAKLLEKPLGVPVVYNCGGYEKVETLRALEGKIDIYLPDMKYHSSELSKKYSNCPDYFEVTKKVGRWVGKTTIIEAPKSYRLNRLTKSTFILTFWKSFHICQHGTHLLN